MTTYGAEQLSKRWIDDYLDLFNFAGSIGDTEWQQDIMTTLNNRNLIIQQEVRTLVMQQLWLKYDSVNEKMLELFAEMKKTTSSNEESVIKELIWNLKLQRIDLARRIRTYCG